MIEKIEFKDVKHEDQTKCILYLVTDDSKNELKTIKEEIGIDSKDFPGFQFNNVNNIKYIFAKVTEICPNILGQVLDYADFCAGVRMSYMDMCDEIEKMIKNNI